MSKLQTGAIEMMAVQARQRLPEMWGDHHQASRAQRTENALQNSAEFRGLEHHQKKYPVMHVLYRDYS